MWFVLYLFICSFYFSFWNETKIYTHTQLTSLDVKIPNGIASIMKPKNKINRIHHESIWYPISPEIKIIHGIVCAMRPTTKFLLHEIIVNAKLIRLLLKTKNKSNIPQITKYIRISLYKTKIWTNINVPSNKSNPTKARCQTSG